MKISIKSKFCWGAIILLAATVAFYGVSYIIRSFRFWEHTPEKMPCVWKNDAVKKIKLPEIPSCLVSWRYDTKTKVREETQIYLDKFMSSNQYETVCQKGSTLAIIANREPHHQPHFGGQFFFYFSLMLWQDFIFESKSCLRHFLVEEESREFWRYYLEDKRSWTIQLLEILKNHLPGNFLASSGCAIEKHKVQKMSIPKLHDWFIHPSDAYLMGSLLMNEHNICESVSGKGPDMLRQSQLQFTMLHNK